eukprot:scaffold3243_cov173-Ochromonas_danica.AAC.27
MGILDPSIRWTLPLRAITVWRSRETAINRENRNVERLLDIVKERKREEINAINSLGEGREFCRADG